MHLCKSGKHRWTNQDDAEKCCNGYRRVLVIGGGTNQQPAGGVMCGRRWVPNSPPTSPVRLVPKVAQSDTIGVGGKGPN